MCKLSPSLVLATLLPVTLSAAETNFVDVVALGEIRNGESSDGWTVSSVTNYAERYYRALRFTTDSYVISPTFNHPVTQLKMVTISSSDAARRLTVTPLREGVAATNLSRACTYSSTAYRLTEQKLTWPRGANVRSFRLQLEGGGSTGWGIRTMSVISDDPASGLVLSVR